ncbi:TraG family conjugative transposon ATPase [Marinilongibacter aquaticus]|uniref:TraG family conjugative transposon ATPase n=1 Tax=Marinilongibacter aquaticus TaxID=2975157 RepID=UPI0021BD0F12|nr:TraG family conjugative transposon ATPase [Marinilongibacter aquaticus]UBM58721.1 TraG family conjugative transposon ATPase [Marinilongibacter aquaticus]
MERELEDISPIMDIENDCILSKQGDITLAFKVDLPEIFTLSDQEYETLHQTWVKALRILPPSTVFHKQDWFLEDAYRPEFQKAGTSFLNRSSDLFFNERPFLDHSCYLMLTRKPSGRTASSSLFSGLLRKSIVPRQTLDRGLLEDFMDTCGQFRKILEDSGLVSLHRMGDRDLRSGHDRQGLIERYFFPSPNGERSMIGDIQFGGGLQIADRHCQLYTLADAGDLPSVCGSRTDYDRYSTDRSSFSVGFAANLGQLLSCNHVYNQYIFIQEARRTIRRLESKRLRLQSLSAYSRENLIARDAANDFLNEALARQRMPVKAHFNILAWTRDPDGIKPLKNRVASALARMDATCKVETLGAPQIFWAGIPGNAGDFPMNDTFDTFAQQASCFLNMETGYRSSLSPVGLRLGDRLTGRPIHVDISDEPLERGICTNRNKFILGPSGSGKSFFTNHMLRSYYEQGTHIVLVDVGHSYRGLCQMVGGHYFTYSEEDPIRFNPFHIGPGDSLDTEKRESIKTLLLALWKKDDEEFKRSEYVALSNALNGYFEHLGKCPHVPACFDSFYDYLTENYLGLLSRDKVKEKDFDIDNFLYVLRPYYKGGEFDYLLNARENRDLLHERFIVFELDNIKDHPILFPVVTIIIMEVFINKMRKMQGVRKMILIEEAWKALMKEGFAEYIKYLFKTVRKFFGEAVVVTQEVEDIISSRVVKQAIINNSDCKILLDQSKYRNKFDQIQELLGLTDKERALVLSVNRANDPKKRYKEVFIGLGSSMSRVYRTEVSPEEYLVYTTEQKERLRVSRAAERFGGDIGKGVAALAGEMKKGKQK